MILAATGEAITFAKYRVAVFSGKGERAPVIQAPWDQTDADPALNEASGDADYMMSTVLQAQPR